MIVHLDALAPDAPVVADLCIVGAGVAGLAIVSQLLDSAITVVVAESGPGADDLSAGEVVGSYHGLAGRQRALGGTTEVWPGQVLRLAPLDLEPREWVDESGWPLEWDELDRWYPPALELFGASPAALDGDVYELLGREPPLLDDTRVTTAHSIFVRRPRLGRTMEAAIERSQNVTVLLGATAIATVPAEGGRSVERVELRSLSGRDAQVVARAVALCGGGIENPRLLLASRLGNDVVGRYFLDHVWARTALVRPLVSMRELRSLTDVFVRRRVRYSPKLVLAPAAQAAERVLGCYANLVFEPREASGSEAAARLYRSLRTRRRPAAPFRDTGRVARDPLGVLSRLAAHRGWRWPRQRAPERVDLLVVAEQAPSRDSRITLSDRTDRFDVPLPRVDWRPGELERRTLVAATEVIGGELEKAGLATVEPANELHDAAGWRDGAFDSFHHTGATRMSDDPDRGVVDSDCRVHGVANLYVGGSSVFPTTGYANPTLTIAALALRLGAHLRRELTG